eukprot:gene28818-35746_t
MSHSQQHSAYQIKQNERLTRRKNDILKWLQESLSITLQTHLSANKPRSSARSRSRSPHSSLLPDAHSPSGLSVLSYLGRVMRPSEFAAVMDKEDSQPHPLTPTSLFQDPFLNGLLLSEAVAAMLIDEKELIKQVTFFDQYGSPLSPPRLILVGTEQRVTSRAQIIHNLDLCLHTLKTHLQLTSHWSTGEEVLESVERMWDVFEVCKGSDERGGGVAKRRLQHGGASSRGGSKSRSVTPEVVTTLARNVKSINTTTRTTVEADLIVTCIIPTIQATKNVNEVEVRRHLADENSTHIDRQRSNLHRQSRSPTPSPPPQSRLAKQHERHVMKQQDLTLKQQHDKWTQQQQQHQQQE